MCLVPTWGVKRMGVFLLTGRFCVRQPRGQRFVQPERTVRLVGSRQSRRTGKFIFFLPKVFCIPEIWSQPTWLVLTEISSDFDGFVSATMVRQSGIFSASGREDPFVIGIFIYLAPEGAYLSRWLPLAAQLKLFFVLSFFLEFALDV